VKTAAAFAAWACRHRLRSAASENAAPPLPRPRVAHAAIDLDIKRKLEEEVSNRWFVPKEALLRRQVVGVKHALKQLYFTAWASFYPETISFIGPLFLQRLVKADLRLFDGSRYSEAISLTNRYSSILDLSHLRSFVRSEKR
jgi:hypothetical protein